MNKTEKIRYPIIKLCSLKDFRKFIINVIGSENDLYFASMQDMFFADCKPEYPKKSNADFTIGYDWIKSEFEIYSNLYSSNLTIIRFENIQEFIKYFKS